MLVEFSAAALADAEAAVRWYRQRGGSAVSEAFATEIKRISSLASSRPQLGFPGIRGTYRLHLRRFPYTLVYAVQADVIRILAVAHQRRRPDYWTRQR